jgi:peptide/nickel transport system substrate-binding protein
VDDLLLGPVRPQHDRPAQDLTGRALRSALALVAVAALAAGCSDDDDRPVPAPGAAVPGAGGALAWALSERPTQLDPLFAATPAATLVSRQIHEPLVARLGGPVESARRVPGLALSVFAVDDATVWRLRLRSGVRFQDRTLLNAQGVLANAERWLAFPEQSGIPEGTLVDAPVPDLVRFRLPASDPSFGELLASPRLGIVSPVALRRAGGGAVAAARLSDSGTGPFELRERAADRLLLARNSDWWGSGRGLGPAIDQLEFLVVGNPDERVAMLAEGAVQVASGIGPRERRAVRSDPLLTTVPQEAGGAIGTERSVRGIPPDDPVPSLNAVWQTRIEAA